MLDEEPGWLLIGLGTFDCPIPPKILTGAAEAACIAVSKTFVKSFLECIFK